MAGMDNRRIRWIERRARRDIGLAIAVVGILFTGRIAWLCATSWQNMGRESKRRGEIALVILPLISIAGAIMSWKSRTEWADRPKFDPLMSDLSSLRTKVAAAVRMLSFPLSEEDRAGGWVEKTQLTYRRSVESLLFDLNKRSFPFEKYEHLNLARELDFSGVQSGPLSDILIEIGNDLRRASTFKQN